MKTIERFARSIAQISTPLIDRILKWLSCSRQVTGLLKFLETRRLNQITHLQRILIIPDINIGDAIITQGFIPPFKNFFPDIEVSYAYQNKAYPLIEANPNIDRHYPFFENLGYLSERDSANLNSLVKENKFDLIANFCPNLPRSIFKGIRTPLIYPIRLIKNILQAYQFENQKAQLAYQLESYAQELAGELAIASQIEAQSPVSNAGLRLYFEPRVWEETQMTLHKLGLDLNSKKIFFNPDTGSRYTLIPIGFQSELLKGILSHPHTTVLLNCGFVFKNIEETLMENLSRDMRKRTVIIPKDIPLDVFAGLIDQSEMAVTGDTAPLHIAAAEKVVPGPDNPFRNSTAIVGIFGATSSKVYGYDSFSSAHIPANQEAPSKTFEGFPSCKNLACLDKLHKNCRNVRCFEPLKAKEVVEYILDYLFS